MKTVLGLVLLLTPSAQDILAGFEKQLDAGFNESIYRRYLYYCRQQNQGERLAEHSERWLKEYPNHQILRFGIGEGLLMAGEERDAAVAFRELYADHPEWANEIIFTLDELSSEEVIWFITEERKRTSNPTLHARIVIEYYIENENERKALSELADAISAGANPASFRHSIQMLSERLGTDQIFKKVKGISPELHFRLALELGDEGEIQEAINSSTDQRKLLMMAQLCERKEYLEQALAAYEKAGQEVDAARVLITLGRKDEARTMLEKDNTRAGQEQRALLLAGNAKTYKEAAAAFKELTRKFGSRPEWIIRIATLELLQGHERSAYSTLEGVPQDSAVLFLKGIVFAAQLELDSLKMMVDRSILRFPGNAYENDLILLYKIALAQSGGLKEYASALAAYHWTDAEDAYNRSLNLAEENENLADEALLLAAESLARLGRWKEAEMLYVKLVENHPKSPLNTRAQYERAVLLKEKLDDPTTAKEIFEELILRNPTSLYADLARQEM